MHFRLRGGFAFALIGDFAGLAKGMREIVVALTTCRFIVRQRIGHDSYDNHCRDIVHEEEVQYINAFILLRVAITNPHYFGDKQLH